MVRSDEVVYAGYSAGAVVAGPSLVGIDLVDDPTEVPEGYMPEPLWDGLGFVDYTIAPHYKSDHPESAMVDDVVAYLQEHRLDCRPLRDGEVIIVDA